MNTTIHKDLEIKYPRACEKIKAVDLGASEMGDIIKVFRDNQVAINLGRTRNKTNITLSVTIKWVADKTTDGTNCTWERDLTCHSRYEAALYQQVFSKALSIIEERQH